MVCLSTQIDFNNKNTAFFTEHPVINSLFSANGTAICTESGHQTSTGICSDGSGGAIIAWADDRGSSRDIYAQRIDSAGNVRWTAGGVAICTASNAQESPQIVSDGTGGAIITWQDKRVDPMGDAYAQRINATGVPQWTSDGVVVCTASYNQQDIRICSDGAGGAIITWRDLRTMVDLWLYAQRINNLGAPQWTANGLQISTIDLDSGSYRIESDGSGGAIITFIHYTAFETWNDIYAQRINAAGAPQWTATGVAVCTATGNQADPHICSDGSGGAIITWQDPRSGTDLYAQRINAAGTPQWTGNGTAICTAANTQLTPRICSDDAGGAIITWRDQRIGNDIYAQRVTAAGAPQWTIDGVEVCTADDDQVAPQICSDDNSGAYIAWTDHRNGANNDVYAQWIDAGGSAKWRANGSAVSTANSNQQSPVLCYDGINGAFIAWIDYRDGSWDIYATAAKTWYVQVDSIAHGSQIGSFYPYSLYFSDTGYHQISSADVGGHETVTVVYRYEFPELIPYFIQNMTIDYTYNTTASSALQIQLEIYNVTSGSWDLVFNESRTGP